MSRSSGKGRHLFLRRSWPLLPALVVILLASLWFAFTTYGRAAVSAAFFLPDLMTDLPVRPVTWVTGEPRVERVLLPYDDRYMPADVYLPADGGRHGALILSPGAPPLEPDDPRLIRLAGDIARAGIVMLVPFSPDLDAELIEPREVEALVSAFQYLQRQPYVDPEKIGYIGVSIGAPLALLAASDERINEDVFFVVSFGGYYDLHDLVASITTGVISYGGKEESWEPRRHTVKVMSKNLIARLDDPQDQRILTRVLVERKPEATEEFDDLSSQGQAAYDLLTNRDPARFGELLDRLPADAVQFLGALSLTGHLDGLRAETFVLHDRSDRYVPYVESRRLRDAIEGQVKLHYTEVNIFEHVEPTAQRAAHVLVTDSAKLLFHLYQMLLRFNE
jgi:pimeloyl-ACP methyl ester carboxylesterase